MTLPEYLSGGRIQGKTTDTSGDVTTGWTIVGSTNTPNGTTGVFDFGEENNVTHLGSYDLGSGNVAGNAWALRCKMVMTDSDGGSSDANLIIGLSDSATAAGDESQDFIVMRIHNADVNLVRPNHGSDSSPRAGQTGGNQFLTVDEDVNYYIELKRTSDTAFTWRFTTNSAFTGGSSGTVSISAGTVTGLRYIKIMNVGNCTSCSTFTGYIDDLQYWADGDTTGTATHTFDFELTDESKAAITNVQTGTRYEEVDTRKIFIRAGAPNIAGWVEKGTAPMKALRMVIGGGASSRTQMDYLAIDTLGDSADFGDLSVGRDGGMGSCQDATRGCYGGGQGGSKSDVIDYITIATLGDATDFGNLIRAKGEVGGCSNDTRGIFAGGSYPGTYVNEMDYITILTTGNATDFGNLTAGKKSIVGLNDSTRGVFAGHHSYQNVMDYITTATLGDATDFGDLVSNKRESAQGGASNYTRGIFAGGKGSGGYINEMDYITIATTGNATDFGDLTSARSTLAGAPNANALKGVFAGGNDGSSSNVIDYVTIATLGNATDFGDLSSAQAYLSGVAA